MKRIRILNILLLATLTLNGCGFDPLGCSEKSEIDMDLLALAALLNTSSCPAGQVHQMSAAPRECTYTISAGTTTVDARDADVFTNGTPKGGDVICIDGSGGDRDALQLDNFQGESCNPIIFINSGGQVVIDATINGESENGILFQNSRHVWLSGTGSDSDEYGFVIKNTLSKGIQFFARPTDIEVDHVQIENIGYRSGSTHGVGISIDPGSSCRDGYKNNYDYDFDGQTPDLDDVDCGYNPNDPLGSYCKNPHETRNLVIHHNYIKTTSTEGMYFGNSYYSSGSLLSGCGAAANEVYTVFGPLTIGLQVHNNRVEDSGWDSIQSGSAVDNCNIYNNTVLRDSRSDQNSQRAGIMNEKGSNCNIYNNFIKDGLGDGIYIQGNGSNLVYNNFVVNAAHDSTASDTGYGISVYTGSNSTNLGGVALFNNTIIGGQDGSVYYGNTLGFSNSLFNNMLLSPQSGTYVTLGASASVSPANNLETDTSSAGLVNTDTSSTATTAAYYCPALGSAAIDVGAGSNATTDHFGKERNGATDIGACEY